MEYSNVNSEMMNSTLLFIFFGIIASSVGIGFGGAVRNHLSARSSNFNGKGLFVPASLVKLLGVAFFLIMVFQLLKYYIIGYTGSTGSGEKLSFFWRYPARLFNPVIMIMVLFAAYIVYSFKKPHKWAKYVIVFCMFFLVFFLFAQASRSGLFEVVILCLVFNIAHKGNFRIRLSGGKAILVLLLIPVSVITYIYASSLRESQWRYGDISLNSYIKNYHDTISTVKETSLSDIVSPISYRLNSIRPIFCVMHGKDMGLHDISDMVNLKTILLSSLDRITPGKLFEGIINSEYAFGFMYQPGGVIAAVEADTVNYVGYEWNAFGISYQLFGYWGGIIFIFLISALFGYLADFFATKRGLWGCSYGILCIYSYHMWVVNVGIDNLISVIWSYFLTMTCFLFCIEIFRELPEN